MFIYFPHTIKSIYIKYVMSISETHNGLLTCRCAAAAKHRSECSRKVITFSEYSLFPSEMNLLLYEVVSQENPLWFPSRSDSGDSAKIEGSCRKNDRGEARYRL